MATTPVIVIQIIHIEGPLKGEIQDLSDSEISIGRHPSCHVQFPQRLKDCIPRSCPDYPGGKSV